MKSALFTCTFYSFVVLYEPFCILLDPELVGETMDEDRWVIFAILNRLFYQIPSLSFCIQMNITFSLTVFQRTNQVKTVCKFIQMDCLECDCPRTGSSVVWKPRHTCLLDLTFIMKCNKGHDTNAIKQLWNIYKYTN